MAERDKYLDFEKPILDLEERIESLRATARAGGVDSIMDEIAVVEAALSTAQRELAGRLTPWQRTQLARHPMRPGAWDLAERCCEDIFPLFGDRLFAEDGALMCALAKFRGREILLIAQLKGRDPHERVKHNFGMAHPEGYRKAVRISALAAKFHRPVLLLIDTPGAFPGIGAEERGQAWAIAESIEHFMNLETPSIACVIGEGGSGGALALGVADCVLMLENAIYSVISPEGCASILFRDASRAPEAAAAMHVTAQDALRLGVVDEIIEEPPGGAHRDWNDAALRMGDALERRLGEVIGMNAVERRDRRYAKFRVMGTYQEA